MSEITIKTELGDLVIQKDAIETITGSNNGAGAGVYAGKVLNELQYRSIIGGDNITATENTDDITLDVTQAGGANLGAGEVVFAGKNIDNLEFKTITASGAVTLTSDSNELNIDVEDTAGDITDSTINVNPATGDDANDGVSAPVETVGRAFDIFNNATYGNTIQLSAGSFPANTHGGNFDGMALNSKSGDIVNLKATWADVTTFTLLSQADMQVVATGSPGWTTNEHKGRYLTWGEYEGIIYRYPIIENDSNSLRVGYLDAASGGFDFPAGTLSISESQSTIVEGTTRFVVMDCTSVAIDGVKFDGVELDIVGGVSDVSRCTFTGTATNRAISVKSGGVAVIRQPYIHDVTNGITANGSGASIYDAVLDTVAQIGIENWAGNTSLGHSSFGAIDCPNPINSRSDGSVIDYTVKFYLVNNGTMIRLWYDSASYIKRTDFNLAVTQTGGSKVNYWVDTVGSNQEPVGVLAYYDVDIPESATTADFNINGLTFNWSDLTTWGGAYRDQWGNEVVNVQLVPEMTIFAGGLPAMTFDSVDQKATLSDGLHFSTGPQIRRLSDTTLSIRNNDDDAYLNLNLSQITATYRAIADRYEFSPGTMIRSYDDGILRLLNSTQDDFDMLQFGGETSSFPAIKAGASGFTVRNASDDGDLDLAARNLYGILSVFTSANSSFSWLGRARVYSPSVDEVRFRNSGNDDFANIVANGMGEYGTTAPATQPSAIANPTDAASTQAAVISILDALRGKGSIDT